MVRVRRALLSVSDKRGLVELGRGLTELGIELVSTGGTARALQAAGLAVRTVSDLTGSPEMMDGRVKTLHPRVHGGILARRDNPGDLAALRAHDIGAIDLVVVNLYPFQETVARPDVTMADAVEQIDIGGPTMVRAAAKNHAFVGVVTSPDDYGRVLEALAGHDGALPDTLRAELAAAAFLHTAGYDSVIAGWLGSRVHPGSEPEAAPAVWGQPHTRRHALRYGENPHQPAALYTPPGPATGLVRARQLQGKALSYNNWMDMDAAFQIARDLGPRGIAIIKHANPCGAAVSTGSLLEAYERARACDPVSSFGGIVCTQGVIDEPLAAALAETFLEVILASGVTDSAQKWLSRKKRLRVLTLDAAGWGRDEHTWLPRPVSGGLLVQRADPGRDDVRGAGRVVTERAPTEREWSAMAFGWTICQHVKSNAIIFSHADATAAIGAGQMSRVDSSRVAVLKATSSLEGTALASDAFFPFPDGVEAAAEAGATAVIQPGGSIRDEEVIARANELGLTMVFTGRRHFRH